MKNLEEMGVLEMNAAELKKENGGFVISFCIALGVCCGLYTYLNWDAITK
jgi:hypothetical protein